MKPLRGILLTYLAASAPAWGQTALRLMPGSSQPGGTVVLSLLLTSADGAQPAALQWTLGYDPNSIVNIGVAAGSSLSAAGKTVVCAGTAGVYTCVASGMNANTIAAGIVAEVQITLSGIAAGSTALSLGSGLGATPDGNPLPVLTSGSSVTVGGLTRALRSYPAFYLAGAQSELAALADGATVTPSLGPSGRLAMRGAGSVQFTPVVNGGGGVSFGPGGQQNQNTAFYTFATGSQTSQIFNSAQGEVAFNLTSAYSFAERSALPQYNYRLVFQVYDDSSPRFYFDSQAGNLLTFNYLTGGTAEQTYSAPPGAEDALFGKGAVLSVKLIWNGSQNELYLNGDLVQTATYTQATPNWTDSSSFSIGAADVHSYGGGLFACDDSINSFLVQSYGIAARR